MGGGERESTGKRVEVPTGDLNSPGALERSTGGRDDWASGWRREGGQEKR